jgi:hypothetical protein
MTKQTSSREFTVCFWNILHDADRPSFIKTQSERLPDIIKLLEKLPEPKIIGLAEVEGTNRQFIVKRLGGQSDYFTVHNRVTNYIGTISQLKFSPSFIQLDKNCRAVVTKYADFTVVVVHLTFGVFIEKLHKQQIKTLLNNLDKTSPTIIMGDFNSIAWQQSRKLLIKSGFNSALSRSFLRRIPTAPSQHYRKMYPEPFKTLGLYGFTIDDIYINGLDVLNFGTLEGESDHLGVWAKLRLSH